jgi:hypothetical protein
MPLGVRNRFGLNGDTSIGRQGRKNLCSLSGEKKATPRPPFVMASKISCNSPQTKNTQKYRSLIFVDFSIPMMNKIAMSPRITANRML